MRYIPTYIETYERGELDAKIDDLYKKLRNCDICPRNCKINRLKDEKGTCKTGRDAIVASYHPHFGEEAPLVYKKGSGTIFFSYCNLLCAFCQNYDISHEGNGKITSTEELSEMMLSLQQMGCHNINLVTPTHVIPQIVKALKEAIVKGLNIPLIYNCGAYESFETLKILEGIIDIYMPDFKFWEAEIAGLACNICNYSQIAQAAIKEMYRQVGDLQMDERGVAIKGLLVRHLVLPNIQTNAEGIMQFIANEISPNTYINIMPQYYPAGRAKEIKELSRSIIKSEFESALNSALKAGLNRIDNRKFSYF